MTTKLDNSPMSEDIKQSIVIMRHAEKYIAKEFKDDSAQLLTEKGKSDTATFAQGLETSFRGVYSSPIPRCLETANIIATTHNSLLTVTSLNDLSCDVRGAYVDNQEAADSNFTTIPPLDVLVQIQKGAELPGMVSAKQGTMNLLGVLINKMSKSEGNLLFVTHDSILAFLTNTLTSEIVDDSNWFGYLENITLTMTYNNKFHLYWSDNVYDITDVITPLYSRSPARTAFFNDKKENEQTKIVGHDSQNNAGMN